MIPPRANPPKRSSSKEDLADESPTTEPEPAPPKISSDWTAELVLTMLGTESLFTFLSILDVDGDGPTTKAALLTAFLTLTAAES